MAIPYGTTEMTINHIDHSIRIHHYRLNRNMISKIKYITTPLTIPQSLSKTAMELMDSYMQKIQILRKIVLL